MGIHRRSVRMGFHFVRDLRGRRSKSRCQRHGSLPCCEVRLCHHALHVSIGWSIYPLGYFFGYLTGAVGDDPLNLIYNVADFVNKIWFCLSIWGAAKAETRKAIASGGLK